jgi:glycerol transport system ATP-binding protein
VAKIELKNVAHSYSPDVENPEYALKKCNLSWKDGGRYAVLGPSGCGKTTMLNIMSGLVTPSEGTIKFDGVDITNMSTAERNIAQVFQFPVIYNTMTVAQNLGFPLLCRNYPKEVIIEKVDQVAQTLGLGNLLNLRATKLTADQKQLISLGRGLVREDVAAILMDEPLTVIDPDLKFRLRRRLKEINELYKSTLIYVTHDQNEAMTFAENILVMDHGKIVQVGTPLELFERPKTTFVGYFIGSPAMNMLKAEIKGKNVVSIGDTSFKTGTDLSKVKSKNVKLGIRSEFVELHDKNTDNCISVKIDKVDDFGNFQLVSARHGMSPIKAKVSRDLAVPAGDAWMKFPDNRCCVYSNEVLV